MDANAQDNILSNIDFATEVKSDRLNVLWKVTGAACLLILLFSVTFIQMMEFSALAWVVAPGVLLAACLLTYQLLRHNHFDLAALTYTLGGLLAIVFTLLDGNTMTAQITPYFLVVVIFIGGLLLSPSLTFMLAVISALATLVLPTLAAGTWSALGMHQFFAVGLIFVGAGLAAQVTGELYAVTQWALQNYERERRTNYDLFESRQQLQKSLRRSESLAEKLKTANTELDAARQSAEKAKEFRGQFLANMSHELRTPLNAIIGFSETMLKYPMMYDDEPLPEAYQGDLNQIYNSGRQLLLLINDILDLARVDAGKLEIYMQQVELSSIVNSVMSTATGLLGGKPVQLKTDMPSHTPNVWADESRVRQVLLNLYSNACKFTDSGSITLKIEETGDGVQISLRDTGIGIESEQLDLIFEEFRQGSSAGRDPRAGSGLGLAISSQLLSLMGGRIRAESTPGEGSTFYVLLQPYHKDQKATVESQSVGVAQAGSEPAADDSNRAPSEVPIETPQPG